MQDGIWRSQGVLDKKMLRTTDLGGAEKSDISEMNGYIIFGRLRCKTELITKKKKKNHDKHKLHFFPR